MAEAKRRDVWEHTAQLSVLLANPHRDPKKKRDPYTVWDFYPFPRPPQKTVKMPIGFLRAAFCQQPRGGAGDAVATIAPGEARALPMVAQVAPLPPGLRITPLPPVN